MSHQISHCSRGIRLNLTPINNDEAPINEPLVSVSKDKPNEVEEPLESLNKKWWAKGANGNEQPVPSMVIWVNHETNHEEEYRGGIEPIQSMIHEEE